MIFSLSILFAENITFDDIQFDLPISYVKKQYEQNGFTCLEEYPIDTGIRCYFHNDITVPDRTFENLPLMYAAIDSDNVELVYIYTFIAFISDYKNYLQHMYALTDIYGDDFKLFDSTEGDMKFVLLYKNLAIHYKYYERAIVYTVVKAKN